MWGRWGWRELQTLVVIHRSNVRVIGSLVANTVAILNCPNECGHKSLRQERNII